MVKNAPTAADVQGWAEELGRVSGRLAPYFSRSEPRQRVAAYLKGLLGHGGRKNGWHLAEAAGDGNPYGVQHLLGRATWDADAVRDELCTYVVQHLADERGVLIVDETGFLKKGTKSAGVQRQYSGTAGRIENCQIGIFLAYAGTKGRALVDRELYLPQGWAQDKQRRQEAKVPAQVKFATKPAIALKMLERALDQGVKAAWVTADEVYGCDGGLRQVLEQRRQPYVMAVRCDQAVWVGWQQLRVKALAAAVAAGDWQRLSAGQGTKGPRWYDWVRLPVNRPEPQGFRCWLLVRRSVADPTELAYYLAGAAAEVELAELVRAAGTRWAVEEAIEAAKGEVGLGHYEVRSYTGWYRHITLAFFALAMLAAIRAQAAEPSKKGGARRNEVQR